MIFKLLKTAVDVATLPLSVAGDVLTGCEQGYTSRNVEEIGDDICNLFDPFDDDI